MTAPTVVALLSHTAKLDFLRPMLVAANPSLDVVTWPDPRCFDAEVAVCWNSPPGVYAKMPRLRLVHSIAAGVDNVVAEQDVSALPVCRVVDPMLAEGMLQFVLWGVLHFHRKLDQAMASQRIQQWKRPLQTPASSCRVGLMGMGELGGHIASRLPLLGYPVSGWARTPREIPDVTMFSGDAGYLDFLAQTDVLVCLLPLTAQTRGILGERTFSALPKGAALIHVGRGEHLVEDDLVAALGSGQLRGAIVDVYEKEPLPADHPLWTTPGLVVTPHMATMATYDVVVQQVVRNIAQMHEGAPYINQVDMARGY
ncbi:2-hydroxyacid dehydrogenase [Variovorax sp. LT2P21]|uniref:2-hydroxyacid dehydrogenase n=1 Tax=Variovorax sp. LT2P21 TaxID=3443731 RepID=UPI003F469F04